MTKKLACILTAVLLTVGFAKSSDGALVFSATSMNVLFGTNSVTTEIRVRSTTGTDTLQYFAIKADVVTVTGTRTLNFGATTQAGTNTARTVTPYVLFDRGTAVTGKAISFAFNASSSSVSFQDGVSVPQIAPGGNAIPFDGVSVGLSPGLLVATLQFNASSTLVNGDSFRIDLSALSSTANAYAVTLPPGGIPADLPFTGAATGRGTGVGTNLNLTSSNFSSGIITAVPEPSTFAMLGLVVGLLGATKLRRRLTRSAI